MAVQALDSGGKRLVSLTARAVFEDHFSNTLVVFCLGKKLYLDRKDIRGVFDNYIFFCITVFAVEIWGDADAFFYVRANSMVFGQRI